MPRGDKSKYSDTQKRQAEHIAESYEERGVGEKEAKSRAWATVNKESGGGEKGEPEGKTKRAKTSSKKEGRQTASTSAGRSKRARPAARKKSTTAPKRNNAKKKSST